MSDRVVLVTGAGGFIGTWVLRELLRCGARPVALDAHRAPERWRRVLGTQDISWADATLTDRDALEEAIRRHGVTHVIHLAALLTPDCQRDPFLGCQVNVLGSAAVFDAARRSGSVRAVSYASSYAVYGTREGETPPMFYGAFKQAVDLIAEQYWTHFGLPSVAIRPHVAYGPERESGLTAGPSLACKAAARGEPYRIGYTERGVRLCRGRGAGLRAVRLPVPARRERSRPAQRAGHARGLRPLDPRGGARGAHQRRGAVAAGQRRPLAALPVAALPRLGADAPGRGRAPDHRVLQGGVTVRISFDDLRDRTAACLEAVAVPRPQALQAAEALATTDAMGVFTHGTKLLAGYLKKLKGGGYDPRGEPRVEREGPGWAVVDGLSGLGQVGCGFAVDLAMRKARAVGIAYVGLRNTGHIGAAGFFAALAAQAGFVAMVTGNDIPSVAAPGSRQAVLGSNPLAYGVPVPDGDPILLDIATAAVAGGKVYAACQRGEPLPPTWLIGPDGLPTTDGGLYPERASLAPMAGHKGYGLGLWCEVLSALLPGGRLTWEVGSWIFDPAESPSGHNAGFVVLDAAAIAPPEEYARRLRKLVD
ncbi:MAG: Ldh family oxidoreductase, partial [Gemmataceae bacterium]|nr:Ldh family oxidoreductase [Gemmataceae bacterium]